MFKCKFSQACVFVAYKEYNSCDTEGKYNAFKAQFGDDNGNFSKKKFLQYRKTLIDYSRKKKHNFGKEEVIACGSIENWKKLTANEKKQHTVFQSCVCPACNPPSQVILCLMLRNFAWKTRDNKRPCRRTGRCFVRCRIVFPFYTGFLSGVCASKPAQLSGVELLTRRMPFFYKAKQRTSFLSGVEKYSRFTPDKSEIYTVLSGAPAGS